MRACIHMMGGWVGSLMEAEISVLTMSVLQIVQELVQVVDCSGVLYWTSAFLVSIHCLFGIT